ncbi:hypothetical protein SAMN05421771_0903 [Granulicella pectinivorans]|jgi:hypothetical protein|uniref:Uncharacterized protein n=1 Tax=Granulicella pectinivorans TaxID=474950 RepID=A0A1I6LLA5_9BACT|nr:hypothetical protein [Granulicella pectinivorans]SFS04347.1 hypothetical protein SAMN05421771_0903 [Granulicella pectinivorans]
MTTPPPNPIDLPAVVAVTANPPAEPEKPMLDVHPPHAPVHGIKDFLLHILTITIGLLIALGLEAGVEYLHHRHIVAEARENIRHEIEANHEQMAKNVTSIQEDAGRIDTNIETIRRMRAAPKDFHGHLAYTMSWSSFNDSAWRSARDMGALTYMPYDEVQGYSDLYGQQQIVNDAAVKLYTSQSLVVAPMIMAKGADAIPPDLSTTMLLDTAKTALSIEILKQMMQSLDGSYTEALKK